ncbi:RNA polymerase II-associated protein 1 [Maniola hyperantus]|uniref:RNA polymerase II-associated protein 1 n=1 Tax=Aphantopus hyperantus TaxID=2795564 RepID=UPI001569C891|nr:RNA polymerase II-associated protein 1 [Maniola hyperantus]
MIRRPKPGEDEEDILRMQQEFLKDKTFQPAAQVVNLRRTEHQTTKRSILSTSDSRKPSKYAQSKGLKEKRPRMDKRVGSVLGAILEKNVLEELDLSEPDNDKNITEETTEENEPTELDDDKVYYPKVIPSILGNIVEKSCDDNFNLDFKVMPSKGFPLTTKRDHNIKPGSKSIFAQNMEKLNKQKENCMDIDTAQPSSSSQVIKEKPKSLNIPSQSFIVSSKEAEDIHKENLNILTEISEQDILQEQQKLLSSLDPKLIDFLRAKRSETISQNTTRNLKVENIEANGNEMSVTEQAGKNEINDTKGNDYLWDNDVLSHQQVNKWLHFENLEKDKLEWIKGMEDRKVKADEPYEARFDFTGYLLPYTVEYTEKTKTLFHHGEDPHRPGYSITEMIELTRSTVTQQRVMALNTIAGILEYYIAGIYKDVIEIPLSKIFFVIRIALDENKLILLEPALKAMRNLLFNRIDEACLDALLGFEEGSVQPCLKNDKSEIEEMDSKETELNDFHLAEIDLISAVLRTDILQRLFYILDTVKPSYNCVQYSLQILTRLSRDSIETANLIVQTDHLMKTIVANFLPSVSINFAFDPQSVYNGKPVLAALKLMRILSLQSKEIGEMLIMKYDLLKPISVYLSSGVDGTYGLRIQIEAFCVLSNLLSHGLGTDNALSLCPLIVTTLYKHVHGTDVFIESSVLSATHAAVVLQFVNKLLNCNMLNLDNYKHQIYPLLKEGVQKWLMQTASLDNYTCGHLRLLCSALDCCKTVLINEKVTLKFLNDTLTKFSSSKGFANILNNILPSSNLLSGIGDEEIVCNKNLVSLGAAVVSSTRKVLPILNITSPVPLLVSLFKLLNIVDDKEIATLFINKVLSYLQQLSKKHSSLNNNWFTRMEVEFVFTIVKLSIQSDISESTKDIIYVIASKLCYILRMDKLYELQYLFNNVIFNKQWFTADRLFKLISLTDAGGLTALTSVEEIKQCYSKVVNIHQMEWNGNIVLKKWQEPVLPRDWIYLPIVSLYSSNQEVKFTSTVSGERASKMAQQQQAEKEVIIRCSLEWILFNEITFPDLLSDIEVTDRFCRIMCVFLCDNSLFLDKKINNLLRKCMQVLYKDCQKFNFDNQLTGLSNFQDFYTQILEQFQSVSYGDHTFASCVLVPLAQKHNVKWRKLLWSEYAGCLRALDCRENYLCYKLDEYYYPEETDESLLKSYARALSSNLLRPDTIVYKIAQHHIECFKKRQTVA